MTVDSQEVANKVQRSSRFTVSPVMKMFPNFQLMYKCSWQRDIIVRQVITKIYAPLNVILNKYKWKFNFKSKESPTAICSAGRF